MAHRPKGFGMTAELANKKAAKFSAELASDSVRWIKEVLLDGGLDAEADGLPDKIETSAQFVSKLKDGVLLCKLINVIRPGAVRKINDSKMAFKMMENINNFISACENIGCSKQDLFQTVDLYEGQNVPQVINGIIALGRKAQTIGYDGATLGPTEATLNKREFSEDQLRAGHGIIGLQAGSNQGASQAGQNFGKTRSIMD